MEVTGTSSAENFCMESVQSCAAYKGEVGSKTYRSARTPYDPYAVSPLKLFSISYSKMPLVGCGLVGR